MVGNSLSFLMESFGGHSAYSLLVESLYGVSKYLAGKTIDEATKKLLIAPLLKKVMPKSEETPEAQMIAKADFADGLTKYLEQNNRAIETTLRCLEQFANRMDNLDKSMSKPIFIALGLPTDRPGQEDFQHNTHVQSILNDQTPGLPQSIKSGYALLHLRRGNKNLAELYARSTLRANPTEARAWYVLGMLKLQDRIIDISPPNADKAERCLATAAEAGLSAQCAVPRAALRIDHFMPKGRRQPAPSLKTLGTLYGKHYQDARSWPYGPLSDHLPTSVEFKRLWKGG